MPKFPFTNYHELNLDWILKKVTALFDASEENAATIRTYNARLTNAEQTATNAETAATSAETLASAAAMNANDALSIAGTADAKADSALTAATDAVGTVAGAMSAAMEAQQTAGAAVATANDAAATASSLESLANTANQNATAALETAQTADQKAVAAQTAAATADQKAVAAQTAATTNAGNISTLQTNVSNLNRQISDVEESLNTAVEGLSEKTYEINLHYEYGYIDGSTGAERSNTINARSTLFHLNIGDYITVDSSLGSAVYHIYIDGVWNRFVSVNGMVSLQYATRTNTDNGYKLTANVPFDLRIVVNRTSNAEITDLTQAEKIASATAIYEYKRIDTLERKFILPTYSKTEYVVRTIAPTTYAVNFVMGHVYRVVFKSSEPLNQQSFYLQIWATEDTTDVSNVLKNFGNVWGTQDTSNELEYSFAADNNYDGYFRFGYALSSIPNNVVVIENIYDESNPTEYSPQDINDGLELINNWTGKKIVWFGTSIPAGAVNVGGENGNGSYPIRVGSMLNATVYNEAIGSSAARIGMHGSITSSDPNGYAGVPATCCLLALSGTVAEKQSILDNWNTWKNVFTIGVDDIDVSNPDLYLNSSYERKLDKYLTGGSIGPVDLYVFDHGYNDGGNGNGSNYSDTTDVPSNPLDRTYFIGAMNFLIDRIKSDNYKASVVIISHYNDEGAFADLVEAQEYIADKWNIPFINISNKMGFSTAVSVTINGTTKTMKNWWLPDGIHPSSDSTGAALKHYADVLYPLIRDAR